MLVRLPSTAARGALFACALIVAVYLTYFSVRTARATYYSELQTSYGYEKAAQIEPENPRNSYLLGRYLQYSLEDPNPDRAINSYKTSLQIDPRQTLAWLDLATTYEMEGRDTDARDAFISAKKSYPLSADVSWQYGNFLLRRGETERAFAEIRQSVVADPRRAPEAFSRCVRVEPDADAILDRVLPVNRDAYIAVIQDLATEQQTQNALKVWKRLADMHSKVTPQDISQLVLVLRQTGQMQEARNVWLQASELGGIGGLQDPKDAVWDGGFESDITGFGYAWRFSKNARGVQIGFDRQERHSGNRSLRVTFDGDLDIDFRDVCQTVPVTGTTSYEVSGWIHTESLTTDQGVRFELRGAGSAPVTTPEVHGSQPWTHVEATWESAGENKEAEICVRRLPSVQENNRIQGAAWIDDVALTPATKTGVKP